jgi:hypothetical protein
MSTPIIQVSVLPAAPVLNVQVQPALSTIVSNLQIGAPGANGLPGAPGSDASVTAVNIVSALGYVPDAVGKITLLGIDTPYLSAQTAFDAAYSNPQYNGTIFFPEGNFTIYPSADWPTRIQIAGCGVKKTTLTITGANGADGYSGTDAPDLIVTDFLSKSLTVAITGGTGGSMSCGGKAFHGGNITATRCFGSFIGGTGGYGGGNNNLDDDGNYFCPEAADGGNGGNVTLNDCTVTYVAPGLGGGSYSDPNNASPGNDGVVNTLNISFPAASGTVLLDSTASFDAAGSASSALTTATTRSIAFSIAL